jgi:hypothetical protein
MLLAIGLLSDGVAAQSSSSPGRPNCDARPERFAHEADPGRRAGLMLDAAWTCWLDFDGYENRNNRPTEVARTPIERNPPRRRLYYDTPGVLALSGLDASFPIERILLVAAAKLRDGYAPLPFDVAGEADYLKAKSLAGDAYALAPDNARAFMLLAQLAAARSSWTELGTLAGDRLERSPADGWAWLALGLATHRLTPSGDAAAIFDSAFVRLGAAQTARLDRF